MRVLGAISTSERIDYSNDFSSLFETCCNHRLINEIRDEWIRGDKDVSTWNEQWHQQRSEALKEAPQRGAVVISQDCKSRDGLTLAAVECRRNTPNAAFALSELL